MLNMSPKVRWQWSSRGCFEVTYIKFRRRNEAVAKKLEREEKKGKKREDRNNKLIREVKNVPSVR